MPSSKESLIQLVPVGDGIQSFNLSQDINGVIQIKIAFFKQLRLFSFKEIRTLHRVDSHSLCRTSVFWSTHSIISPFLRAEKSISHSGNRLLSEIYYTH